MSRQYLQPFTLKTVWFGAIILSESQVLGNYPQPPPPPPPFRQLSPESQQLSSESEISGNCPRDPWISSNYPQSPWFLAIILRVTRFWAIILSPVFQAIILRVPCSVLPITHPHGQSPPSTTFLLQSISHPPHPVNCHPSWPMKADQS